MKVPGKVGAAHPRSRLVGSREAIVHARIEVDAQWRWSPAKPDDPAIGEDCCDVYFRIKD